MTEIVSWQETTGHKTAESNADNGQMPGSDHCEFLSIGEETCFWQIVGENRSGGGFPDLCQERKTQTTGCLSSAAHTHPQYPYSWLK